MTSTTSAVDDTAGRAATAYETFSQTSPAQRANALTAIADAMSSDDSLVATAQDETGLSQARLAGELKRTQFQLRAFADTVQDGTYLDVRIDPADPDFALGPRPDVRRYLQSVGPIVNFAASNFPFAFSVLGGDTAAALAAGCPVVVKAHPGHPRLSDRCAALAREALASVGLPEDTLQIMHGQDEGVHLLQHPQIRAATFTGSVRAGRLLADIAAARPAPIPFFGELGSVNPVIVTAAALDERAEQIATGYVGSVAGSAGQLCTKPGFLFVPQGHPLDASIADAASQADEHRLLNPKVTQGYVQRRDQVLAAGVRVIAEGAVRIDDDGNGWATPTMVSTTLAELAEHADTLLDECFGPLSIIVEYPPAVDLAAAMSDLFEGNLTATVHCAQAESGEQALQNLVRTLGEQAGRVLIGGWPTGVAVTPAMQHGGPWPATTNDSGTSVGSAAISRFLRPVAYQGAPQDLLPAPLRDDNPWGVPQTRTV